MLHTYGTRGTLYAAMLLGSFATHFVTPVQGVPEPASEGLMTEQRKMAAHSPVLDSRQSVPASLAKFPADLLSQFLRLISSLPEGAAALDAVGVILTPLQQSLADLAGINTKRDDLKQNAPCANVIIIFARGTTEPGNVGLVTGPPFFDALRKQLGDRSLAVQGVDYPATFAGFNRNGTDGVQSM